MRVLLNIVVVISLIITAAIGSRVFAQGVGPVGVANYVKLNDKNVQDGSIVSSSPKGFTLSTRTYDRAMVGIVSLKPAILFDVENAPEGSYPVVTSGQAFVLVSGANGPIKKGDLVTSSADKGIGMRATRTGFVLGYALEDFTPKKPSDIRKIALNIKIYLYTADPTLASNIWDIFNVSSVAAVEEPIRVFRYAMAGVVLILSVILGFVSFARMASRGIEALGRNPLASRMIQVGIVLNIFLTIVIVVAGILVALFIVRL